MARIWITGQKTVTGREYKLAVLCADGCAFRIANPRACIERGLFGAARQFSRRPGALSAAPRQRPPRDRAPTNDRRTGGTAAGLAYRNQSVSSPHQNTF